MADSHSSQILDEEEETAAAALDHKSLDFSLYDLATATTSLLPFSGDSGSTRAISETGSSGSCSGPSLPDTEAGIKPSKPRRRKARMNEVDEETQSRRRAQNRESQQAYRHRREDYIQRLQSQIVALHLRHRDLCQSYYSQDRRLSLLREVAADLTTEVSMLRRRQSQSQNQQHQLEFEKGVELGSSCDCTTATPISNDSIYSACASTHIERDGAVFPPPPPPLLGRGLQEWLPGSAPTYPAANHASVNMALS
ncbi:hypothetical protein AYO22_10750 [Fonsecaea multimorphosa]|nr:hypothetical protein AYO22_10750 [Fonsecaea multimorphosa]